MDKVYRNRSGYFDRAFGNIEVIADEMGKVLESVEFDTMVGTGLSGTLVVPTLARAFGKYWAIVRKEVSVHASGMVEGEIGQSWLFVDDFIATGETFRRVQDAINDIKMYDEWDNRVQFPTRCVGTYEYERNVRYAYKPY